MSRLQPIWLGEAAVRRLLAALAANGIEARFVGGCVRDALLGLETGDIDLATPARPETVAAALAASKIKAVPTGIAHGTVTAVIAPRHFEITTLRRDVETDGRHAVVAFDAGWSEDAARRDFTINAIYLAPDGTLYDPVDGRADLAARRVRFVGDPAMRIVEDVLRLLRYYRFEARFGSAGGDPAARAACRAAVAKLPALSAERVSRELMRLLAAPGPIRALQMMREDGVLGAILPEATRLDRLERLIGLEAHTPTLPRRSGRQRVGAGGGLAADPLLRLEALVDVDRRAAIALAQRLRLSNAERNRLAQVASLWSSVDPEEAIDQLRVKFFLFGDAHNRDVAFLIAADIDTPSDRLADLVAFAAERPADFPLNGSDVTDLGVPPGPRVGELLLALRRWWAEGKFAADRGACLARLREIAR